MKLRLVTLNAGLLRRFCGLLEPAPWVDERAAVIGSVVAALEPDIVAFQEVYTARHRTQICGALSACCPYSAAVTTRRPLDNGLVVASRWPLTARLQLFAAGPLEERLLVARGILVCSIAVAGGASLALVDAHTVAGGLYRHPEAARLEQLRDGQIATIMAAAERARDVAVIAGDLNCGPSVSRRNFERFTDGDWIDAAPHLGPTWDPANPLNAGGPHRTSPPQRIDHVLVRGVDIRTGRLRVCAASRVLTEPVVEVPSGRVTPSDHDGVLVELDLH